MNVTGNQGERILVVDRDTELLAQIQEAVTSEGFTCEVSRSAARGLVMARTQMPALMILETHMDGCGGFDFARAVQGEFLHQDIPVIFLSEGDGPEAIAASRTVGGIYFLSKPIDLSVLMELVDKALWMPHLIRRHIDNSGHPAGPKPPRVLTETRSNRHAEH